MTAKEAYEEDVRRRPKYHDGASRKTWEQLGAVEKWTWERNPTPRDSAATSQTNDCHGESNPCAPGNLPLLRPAQSESARSACRSILNRGAFA